MSIVALDQNDVEYLTIARKTCFQIDKCEKKIQEEVNRIKTNLKDQKGGSPWICNPRPNDGTFLEDNLFTRIPRLEDKTITALRNIGITTLKTIATNMEFLKNSSILVINNHLQKITNEKCGSYPYVNIDYKKVDSPYCERYGDNWKMK